MKKNIIMKRINSLEELKSISNSEGGCECFISLNGGLRSSKMIWYSEGKWSILNEIDDTFEEFNSDEEFLDNTNIGKALDVNSLIQY